MPFVCMVAVLSYVLVYGFGLGPIPYFIASGSYLYYAPVYSVSDVVEGNLEIL